MSFFPRCAGGMKPPDMNAAPRVPPSQLDALEPLRGLRNGESGFRESGFCKGVGVSADQLFAAPPWG